MSHLLFAGTSAARPIFGRMTVSTVFYANKGKDLYLFDCGEGVLNLLIQMKVPIERIKGIIITHSHSDHASGIGALVHAMIFSGKREIIIAAPKGIKKLIDVIFEYSGEITPDIISYIDLSDETITQFTIGKINFTSIPIPHRGNVKGHGIICHSLSKNKKEINFALTGDTSDSSPLADFIVERNIPVEILIHECTFSTQLIDKAVEWGHSAPQIVIQTVNKIKPNTCVLHHFSTRYSFDDTIKIAEEIQQNTNIKAIAAFDGMILTFPK